MSKMAPADSPPAAAAFLHSPCGGPPSMKRAHGSMSLSPGWVLQAAGVTSLALACAGAAYGLGSVYALRRFLRRPPRQAQGAPSVTILRPMHGSEPGLYENLLSLADQAYAGPVQIVVGVRDGSDPALPIAQAARAARPNAEIVLVVDPT